MSFGDIQIISVPVSILPPGSYGIMFAVDSVMNGSLDGGAAKDEVRFEVVR